MDRDSIHKSHKIMNWRILIFVLLMILIYISYFLLNDMILQRKKEKEYGSKNEFVKTIDCARLIDEYGEGNEYLLEFDIKASRAGDVLVYFQNGDGSKYSYEAHIQVTTQYQHMSVTVVPVLVNKEETNAYLSFYGEYGTGVIPKVKNISFELKKSKH